MTMTSTTNYYGLRRSFSTDRVRQVLVMQCSVSSNSIADYHFQVSWCYAGGSCSFHSK